MFCLVTILFNSLEFLLFNFILPHNQARAWTHFLKLRTRANKCLAASECRFDMAACVCQKEKRN